MRRITDLTENKTTVNSSEHVLVCLSPAPSNARIIETAANMARAFNASFTALYVKNPNSGKMNEEDEKRLMENTRLAESGGATVATVAGDDIPFQIAEYARLSDVTRIVIGRSAVAGRKFGLKPSFAEQLIALVPNIDIHIIPDGSVTLKERKKKLFEKPDLAKTLKGLLVVLIVSALSTGIGFLFVQFGFSEANIITVYMLGVLVTAALTESKICWVVSAAASVLVFNFLFTEPKYSLLAYGNGYPVTFLIMFASSLVIGGIMGKMKNREREAAKTAYRTRILFDANQLLQKAEGEKEIFEKTSEQLRKLLNRNVAVFVKPATDDPSGFSEAVRWVMERGEKAGRGTAVFSGDEYAYYPVGKNGNVYGVIGVRVGDTPIDAFDSSIAASIIGECAIAVDSVLSAEEKERAAVLAKNEQLRANLLRSISHDLRTPLTSISGNASNLIAHEGAFDSETKKRMYGDIYDDSIWLTTLVENLLSVTRIEEGKMNVSFSTELIDDVIDEAVKHVRVKSGERPVKVTRSDELIFAKMDARLIVQVLINLLDNAVKYTPPGSDVTVSAVKNGGEVSVSVADDGLGIPDEEKPRVFDMFYTGTAKTADSRRSIGLGLYLCKAIVSAHGGKIKVTDNVPHGAVFTFTLPVGEAKLYE